MPRPLNPLLAIELIGHSNVAGLRKGVYIAINPNGATFAQATLLGLLVSGYDDRQIASLLKVRVQTVKNRLVILRDQLKARDRNHLVALALNAGIVRIVEEEG